LYGSMVSTISAHFRQCAPASSFNVSHPTPSRSISSTCCFDRWSMSSSWASSAATSRRCPASQVSAHLWRGLPILTPFPQCLHPFYYGFIVRWFSTFAVPGADHAARSASSLSLCPRAHAAIEPHRAAVKLYTNTARLELGAPSQCLLDFEHAYRRLEKLPAVNSTSEQDGGHSSTAGSKQ
jgi:hypothetical protein